MRGCLPKGVAALALSAATALPSVSCGEIPSANSRSCEPVTIDFRLKVNQLMSARRVAIADAVVYELSHGIDGILFVVSAKPVSRPDVAASPLLFGVNDMGNPAVFVALDDTTSEATGWPRGDPALEREVGEKASKNPAQCL